MGRESTSESSEPLLGPARHSDDDDVWSPTESSSAPPAFTPSTLSTEDWDDARDRRQPEQEALLIDHAPPPAYEQAEATKASWREPADPKAGHGPAPPYASTSDATEAEVAGPRFIEIEVGFAGWNIRSLRRKQRCEKFRRMCRGVSKAVLIGTISTAISLMVIGIICGARRFGWSAVCSVQDYTTRDYQIATLDHFEFSDSHSQNSGLPAKFPGILHILTGPSDQTVDLNVSVRATAHDMKHGEAGAMWRPRKLNSCAEVSLYFRPGLELSSLRIASKRTKLVLASDLHVTESTTISLRHGNLVSKNFGSSRETYIDVRSSSVSGSFGLLDALSIKTQSGSVSIDVQPKPAAEGRPRPAVLSIESRSGSVDVEYPADAADIPDRDYRTSVSTRSGSVHGTFLHGGETTIDMRSGNLDARILPYGAGKELSRLTTRMESGSSHIEVLPPPYGSRAAADSLTKLLSSHSAKSGSLRLHYPEEWQGKIDAMARSGSLQVSGPNVKIDDRSGGANRHLHGVKGNGKSQLKIMVQSGSAEAVIG